MFKIQLHVQAFNYTVRHLACMCMCVRHTWSFHVDIYSVSSPMAMTYKTAESANRSIAVWTVARAIHPDENYRKLSEGRKDRRTDGLAGGALLDGSHPITGRP